MENTTDKKRSTPAAESTFPEETSELDTVPASDETTEGAIALESAGEDTLDEVSRVEELIAAQGVSPAAETSPPAGTESVPDDDSASEENAAYEDDSASEEDVAYEDDSASEEDAAYEDDSAYEEDAAYEDGVGAEAETDVSADDASSVEEEAFDELDELDELSEPGGLEATLPRGVLRAPCAAVCIGTVGIVATVWGGFAGYIPFGANLPYAVCLLAVLEAVWVQGLFRGFAKRLDENAEAKTDAVLQRADELLSALASETSHEVVADDALGVSFLEAQQQLEDTLDERFSVREEKLRREARRELVRVRSQCEALVEKHCVREHNEKKEFSSSLENEKKLRQSEKQEWQNLRQMSEAAQQDAETRIATLVEEAAQVSREVSVRVEESRQLSVEVERLLEEKAELRSQKLSYLNRVASRLRHPIQGISHLAEQLVRSVQESASVGTGEVEQRASGELAEQIEHSCRNLEQMIQQLSDLSRIDSGALKLVYSEVRLGRMVDSVLGQIRASAKAKGLTLTRNLPKDLPVVTLDGGVCTRILQELVANAVQFTERGGQVAIGLRIEPLEERDNAALRLVFEVTDSGAGIPTDARERIFEPFEFGGQRPQCQDRSACGLGLALARGFARALGGDLELETEEGSGSTFRASVLARPVPDRPAY